MHPIHITSEELKSVLPPNLWAPTLAEIERLAQSLVGPNPDGWVRQGTRRVVIAKVKLGSQAAHMAEEIALLNEQTGRILAEGTREAPLRAAAFYHLKFEDSIHPLRDGNGRIGRTLMAAQCSQAYGITIPEILSEIDLDSSGYTMIYAPPRPEEKYELLVDVLSRILAVPVSDVSLPFSLAAAYPEVKPTAASPVSKPSAPVPARRPMKPQARPVFWRKFG
jgi:Fic/DOC family protein